MELVGFGQRRLEVQRMHLENGDVALLGSSHRSFFHQPLDCGQRLVELRSHQSPGVSELQWDPPDATLQSSSRLFVLAIAALGMVHSEQNVMAVLDNAIVFSNKMVI
jgi:hypothetical protein